MRIRAFRRSFWDSVPEADSRVFLGGGDTVMAYFIFLQGARVPVKPV